MQKILFLVKKASESGTYTNTSRSGLRNSAKFVKDAINKFDFVEACFEFCIDGNDVDNKLAKYKPNICIIEALWITPTKMQELSNLHPGVEFIIRIHSKMPFLAMEGSAINWIREYSLISNVLISFNNIETSDDFKDIGISNYYLPNVYQDIKKPKLNKWWLFRKFTSSGAIKGVYRIGCFGAIRPFKNHLNQAMAAIMFAESKDAILRFYVNSGRLEQGGESVLKNLRGLFKDTEHKLIELGWYPHEEFIELINRMDVCMQVSFTESFNIVSADVVSQLVPLVVSEEIDWISDNHVDPNNVRQIAEKIDYVLKYKTAVVEDHLKDLYNYNVYAMNVWFNFLNQ